MLLQGRVAIVTGGTSGLGGEIAGELLAEGCQVFCAGRRGTPSARLTELGGDRVAFGTVDVRDAGSVRDLMADAHEHFGRLDVLVANAGLSRPGSVATGDPADWTDVVRTNLLGTFHCTQAVVPYLEKAGGGRIITLSSALATRLAPGSSAYSASKAAIEAFTRISAVELAPKSITVNCLAPGFIDAGMGRELSASTTIWPQYERRMVMGRLGTGREAARAAVFLAGPDSSYVNGHVLEVNGGLNW
jgi:3-oxoacyl-[acyl-carrier protein] reductase